MKSYVPVIVRYILVTLATAFAAHGWLSPETSAILSQYTDALVGAIVVILTVAYALWRRPSAKALEVAQKVDAHIPKESQVVVKTPGNKPDIVVQPK
jgi:hypothetical protein